MILYSVNNTTEAGTSVTT